MTEHEAKALLKIEKECINRNCDRNCDIVQKVEDLNSAYDTAIKALEEVQQYRAIGTLEELKKVTKYARLAKKHGTVGQALDECAKYEEIGTVEECRVARELQIPRAPTFTDFDDGKSTFAYCPTCDYALGGVRPRLCIGIKTKFWDNVFYNRSCACPGCGQHLDLNCLRKFYKEELSRIAGADMLRDQQAQGEKREDE